MSTECGAQGDSTGRCSMTRPFDRSPCSPFRPSLLASRTLRAPIHFIISRRWMQDVSESWSNAKPMKKHISLFVLPNVTSVEVWHQGKRIEIARRADVRANCFVKRNSITRQLQVPKPDADDLTEGLSLRQLLNPSVDLDDEGLF
jgi:hypothetical protein